MVHATAAVVMVQWPLGYIEPPKLAGDDRVLTLEMVPVEGSEALPVVEILRELDSHGVAVEVLTGEKLEMATAEGEFTVLVRGAVAQFQRKKTGENVKMAMQARAREGRYAGGGPPYGLRYAETRHHVGIADPKRIEIIKLGWEEGVLI